MTSQLPDQTPTFLAAFCIIAACLAPISADAGEPGKLSVGLFVPVQSTQFTSEDRPIETNGGSSYNFGFGASIGWDFNAYVATQLDIHYATVTGGEIDETPPTEFRFGTPGGSAMVYARPFGRTTLVPSLGIGVTHQALADRTVEHFDGDDINNRGEEELRTGMWQGVGAAALAWRPSWDEGSVRLYVEGRINGPPTPIASSSARYMRGIRAWSVSARLGISLFVFG
jgi:hypothetical protein